MDDDDDDDDVNKFHHDVLKILKYTHITYLSPKSKIHLYTRPIYRCVDYLSCNNHESVKKKKKFVREVRKERIKRNNMSASHDDQLDDMLEDFDSAEEEMNEKMAFLDDDTLVRIDLTGRERATLKYVKTNLQKMYRTHLFNQL